ncbi:MAG: RibD family protein [Hydrogenophilaceae bacterium]|jgi:diaminohydroxyphosphoribosylaminopyrimidine deaminase/5-amino-6-(5-phosphoribosylamino)uracil reductase|nr:RibD family protein [Hydrogenophilaceae bacterium]
MPTQAATQSPQENAPSASPRPVIILKLATSLDGRIATATGESRWITGELARAKVHRLRADSDGVLIGSGTALSDDPELTARLKPAAKQPVRIVLDTDLRLPSTSKLARTTDQGQVLIYAARGVEPSAVERLTATGAKVVFVPRSMGGVELEAVFEDLKTNWAVNTLLVEGGGALAASLIKRGLVDRLEWFRAPILLGEEGRAAIGPLQLKHLADAPAFKKVASRQLGPDLWETYEKVSAECSPESSPPSEK